MKLLLTGFEPFSGNQVNPSEGVARALNGKRIGRFTIQSRILPVDHICGPQALLAAFREVHPNAIICLGEADRRSAVSIERAALNLLDFRIADNKGEQVKDRPVIEGAPAAYFSSLPVRSLLKALLAEGIPAEISLSAGTFLCNQVFYTLMNELESHSVRLPAGCIHLPALPEQAAAMSQTCPSMSLTTDIQAIRKVIETLDAEIPRKKGKNA